MNDIIRKLYLRGMSLATALMLAASLVACDETIDLPDGLISDTVSSITQPSESRPNVSETLAPEDTEPKEPEELSPELQEKYPPISEEEYKDMLEKLSMSGEDFKNGIKNIKIIAHNNGNVFATTFAKSDDNSQQHTTRYTVEMLTQILEVAGNNITELNATDYNYPDTTKLYNLDCSENNIHSSKLASILNIIYENKFVSTKEQ